MHTMKEIAAILAGQQNCIGLLTGLWRASAPNLPNMDVWLASEMSKMKVGRATPKQVGGFPDPAPVRACPATSGRAP